MDIDVVVCLELVEHLWPETLKKLPNNIFGFIKPKHVIISTPNSEYNVIFNNSPPRFRHWDHKFEWSRKEFEDWSYDICERFGYEVRFDGVGEPTKDHPEVGFCSQFAIFIQTPSNLTLDLPQGMQSYNLITEIIYPHKSLQALIKQFLDSVSNHLYCKDFLNSSRKRVPIESRVRIKSRTFGRSLFTSFRKICFYKNRIASFKCQFKDAVEESSNKDFPSLDLSDNSSFPFHVSAVWQRLSETKQKYLKLRSQKKLQNQFDDVCDENDKDDLIISQNIFPQFPSSTSFEVYVDESLKIPVCVTTLPLLSPALFSHQIVLTDTTHIFIPLSFLHKFADIIKVQFMM